MCHGYEGLGAAILIFYILGLDLLFGLVFGFIKYSNPNRIILFLKVSLVAIFFSYLLILASYFFFGCPALSLDKIRQLIPPDPSIIGLLLLIFLTSYILMFIGAFLRDGYRKISGQ